MTKSVFFFFLFTVSLLLLLTGASASSGNATSVLMYDGCAPGDTVGECITAAVKEEEGVEAVVRRILQQGANISTGALGKPAPCKTDQYGDCIGAVNLHSKPCTSYVRCKRATKNC